jgi:hypothetical protein
MGTRFKVNTHQSTQLYAQRVTAYWNSEFRSFCMNMSLYKLVRTMQTVIEIYKKENYSNYWKFATLSYGNQKE